LHVSQQKDSSYASRTAATITRSYTRARALITKKMFARQQINERERQRARSLGSNNNNKHKCHSMKNQALKLGKGYREYLGLSLKNFQQLVQLFFHSNSLLLDYSSAKFVNHLHSRFFFPFTPGIYGSGSLLSYKALFSYL
jgi:hypothetical protein